MFDRAIDLLRGNLRTLLAKPGAQRQAAADAGMAYSYLNQIVLGRRNNLSLNKVDQIAEALDVSVSELFLPEGVSLPVIAGGQSSSTAGTKPAKEVRASMLSSLSPSHVTLALWFSRVLSTSEADQLLVDAGELVTNWRRSKRQEGREAHTKRGGGG